MDTIPLRDAYRALLDAAAVVTSPGVSRSAPPAGEWDADQILTHVSLISAATIAAASAVALRPGNRGQRPRRCPGDPPSAQSDDYFAAPCRLAAIARSKRAGSASVSG